MSSPFFSVVIPLFNKEKHIKKTLTSVLDQTFQSFEIIVVDDGSQDKSVGVVESINDPRIRVISQKNSGVSSARNLGIKKAETEYIAFLDADDLWLPDYLQSIYSLINEFPGAGIYSTGYIKRNSIGDVINVNINGLPEKNYRGILSNYFEIMVKGSPITWTSATCVPKNIFTENNIWFPSSEKYGEDQHVWGRIMMRFDLAYDSKQCAIYEIETDNNSQAGIDKESKPHRSIVSLVKHRDEIKKKNEIKCFDLYIEKECVKTIKRNVVNGRRLDALRVLRENNLSFYNNLLSIFYLLTPYKVYKKLKRFIKR
ncbi:hypothetical protein BGL48_15705 [Salinivibrio sp. SS3]|uniref:glycosyltransferase family 2 protein n=1 Tax=Salinivibrio sp. SS3 TaxID=1895021 RepID=UPI0008480CAE|nr:glycosyltransferase family A protein [Salinivibrio sp. BNH]ODP96829.1 hypothetical protein BGL48_15705 [Salinivibrio sp. BNH]